MWATATQAVQIHVLPDALNLAGNGVIAAAIFNTANCDAAVVAATSVASTCNATSLCKSFLLFLGHDSSPSIKSRFSLADQHYRVRAEAAVLESTRELPAPVFETSSSSGRMTSVFKLLGLELPGLESNQH